MLKNFLWVFILITSFYLIFFQIFIKERREFSNKSIEFKSDWQQKKENFLKEKSSKEQAFMEEMQTFSNNWLDNTNSTLREQRLEMEAIGDLKKQAFRENIQQFSQDYLERENQIKQMNQQKEDHWQQQKENFFKLRSLREKRQDL